MLAQFLRLEGIDVVTAENGQKGVEIYQDAVPDICVVDIGLPDLNGYDVAKFIRKQYQQPQLLVALTGYGQTKDRQQVKAAGFDLHLVKPIDPDDLMNTLAMSVERIQYGQLRAKHGTSST